MYIELSADGELNLGEAMTALSKEQREAARVFALLRDPVYRYLTRLLRNAGEAEDLTQEVFLRLYQSLCQAQRIGNVRSWVFRVAHNLAVNHEKQRSRFSALGDTEGIGRHQLVAEGHGRDAEQQLIEKERRRLALEKLRQLSPQQRQCLELRAEGLRYREIADALGIRIPTVVTFLSRALRKISENSYE